VDAFAITEIDDANGNDEGDITTITTPGAADAHELRTAGIIISNVSVTEVKTVTCDGACGAGVGEQAQFTFEFDVEAFGSDIFIDDNVEVAGDGHLFEIVTGGGGTSDVITSTAPAAGTSTWEVAENTTETFTITINYTADAAEFVSANVLAIQWNDADVIEGGAGNEQYDFSMEDFESDPIFLNATAP
jgi:hypothetical protein